MQCANIEFPCIDNFDFKLSRVKTLQMSEVLLDFFHLGKNNQITVLIIMASAINKSNISFLSNTLYHDLLIYFSILINRGKLIPKIDKYSTLYSINISINKIHPLRPTVKINNLWVFLILIYKNNSIILIETIGVIGIHEI